MFDDETRQVHLGQPRSVPARDAQFSLSELFFVVTLLAIEMGVYIHISPLLAFTSAGGLVLAAVIRFADIHQSVLGSMAGYVVVLIVAWIYVATCQPSLSTSVSVLIFLPACGYIVGGLLAESQNEVGT